MSKNSSEYLINRKDNQYEVVIGLEVHAQVLSKSKLFSSSATKFGAEPNTQVSLVDAAFPGMLPVINEYCIKQAIKTGIGLNAKINKRSVFDRKNYFYADLPQGYQISQFKDPIVGEGKVILDMPNGQKEIGIGFLLAAMGLPGVSRVKGKDGKTKKQGTWNGGIWESLQDLKLQNKAVENLKKNLERNPNLMKAFERNFNAN